MTNIEATTTDRRAQRREEKRARILAQAWFLAQRDGLAVISLRNLADRVDLRQPSLYAYFDSKLALYDAMFADGYRQLLDEVRARPSNKQPRPALVDFVRLMVEFATVDIVRFQLLFQRTIPGFEPSPASYALALEFTEVAGSMLAAAGVSGTENLDMFTALVAGLCDQQVANDPGGDRWVRLAGPAVAMFLADVDRRSAASPKPVPKPHQPPREKQR
jgi:AcrR family transcriptional regulator